MDGTVHRIHLAPEQGADPEPVNSVEAVAPNDLVGERFRVVDGGRIGCGDRIQRPSTGAAGSEG